MGLECAPQRLHLIPFDSIWLHQDSVWVPLGCLSGLLWPSWAICWLHFGYILLHIGYILATFWWRCRDGVVTVRLCKCYGGMKSHWTPIVWVFCISKAFPNSFFDTPLQRNDDFHIELQTNTTLQNILARLLSWVPSALRAPSEPQVSLKWASSEPQMRPNWAPSERLVSA